MKDLTQKYIELAEEYSGSGNMEDFSRISLPIRGSVVKGQIQVPNNTILGDPPTGAVIGNVGLTATRRIIIGFGIQRNLPVLIGSAFAGSSDFNFVAKKINGGVLVNVFADKPNNAIVYQFFEGGNGEEIRLSGGNNYDIFAVMQGLYNVKAEINKVRVSLPTEDNSRLNSWQRDGIKLFNLTWLSSYSDNPVTIARAPGQFNKAVYDSNIPVTLSNSSGLAVFIPALPQNVVEESTDITLYFGRIVRI